MSSYRARMPCLVTDRVLWGWCECTKRTAEHRTKQQEASERPARRGRGSRDHGVCTTPEPLSEPADRYARTARLNRSARRAQIVPARRPEQLQPCNVIVAPAHTSDDDDLCERMRSVFGWAEARAHDATTATERSAAGWTVLISNIDHLCARLGGDCRLGGTCRTCQG